MDRLTPSNFKSFYSNYYDRCFLFAKSYVHDDLAAEDIASEALIKLWELSKNKSVESPSRLLFVIVKNRALDHLKHEKIKQNALASISTNAKHELDIRISNLEATDPNKIFAEEIKSILFETISKLPKQTKTIFEMSYLKNISRQEIAEHFKITVKGVDYHISTSLSHLRKNLKDYFPILLYIILTFFN